VIRIQLLLMNVSVKHRNLKLSRKPASSNVSARDNCLMPNEQSHVYHGENELLVNEMITSR